MRTSTIAAMAVAAGLGLAGWPMPAKADLSLGDLQDVFEEPLEEMLGYVEFVVTYYENLPETLAGELTDKLLSEIGTAIRSYLPTGFLPELYPDNPFTVTVGDNKAFLERRIEDKMSRVEEVTGYASEAVRNMVLNATRIDFLGTANKAPVGTTGALQLGNELEAVQAGTLQDISGLLAQSVQLQADEAMRQEYDPRTAWSWAEGHYKNSGSWVGQKTWQPDMLSW